MTLYDTKGRAMRLTPPRLAGLAAGTPHNTRARAVKRGQGTMRRRT